MRPDVRPSPAGPRVPTPLHRPVPPRPVPAMRPCARAGVLLRRRGEDRGLLQRRGGVQLRKRVRPRAQLRTALLRGEVPRREVRSVRGGARDEMLLWAAQQDRRVQPRIELLVRARVREGARLRQPQVPRQVPRRPLRPVPPHAAAAADVCLRQGARGRARRQAQEVHGPARDVRAALRDAAAVRAHVPAAVPRRRVPAVPGNGRDGLPLRAVQVDAPVLHFVRAAAVQARNGPLRHVFELRRGGGRRRR
mmetsp:Transcript_19621/g.60898  ORF Transcript_19621/g.60898 Transcript_19621/m.60898 type:complete len:250 (+) Transcript_19621:369-1118(+)